jgi:hypothetical protein
MARKSIGLAGRLAAFFGGFAASDRRSRRRRPPDDEKHWLAVQLLGTLSPQVLVETGHNKSQARRVEKPRPRLPSPPPVGDLARPRARS